MSQTTNAGNNIVTQDSDHVAVADGTSDVYDEHGRRVPYPNTVPCCGLVDGSTNTTIGDAPVSLFTQSYYTPADQIHGIPAGANNGGFNGVARPDEGSQNVRIEGCPPCRTHDATQHNTAGNTPNTTGAHQEGTGSGHEGDKQLCIDWNGFLKRAEGFRTEGYVPAKQFHGTIVVGEDGKEIEPDRGSGITIASGYDISAHSVAEVKSLGDQSLGDQRLPPKLVNKLVPYAHADTEAENREKILAYENAYPDKNEVAARASFVGPPTDPQPVPATTLPKLRLGEQPDGTVNQAEAESEAKAINEAVHKLYEKKLSDFYGPGLSDLPCKAQTALMSLYYQYGKNVPQGIVDALKNGDYRAARDILYRTPWQNDLDRRHAEGELLNDIPVAPNYAPYDPLAPDTDVEPPLRAPADPGSMTYKQWVANQQAQQQAARQATADAARPSPLLPPSQAPSPPPRRRGH